jgi:hypothetical protein
MSLGERIKIARAVQITGETERTLQAAAAAGRIPGASKPFKCWTFDEAKLRRWIAEEEQKSCRKSLEADEDRSAGQRTRSSAAKRGGRGSRSPAGSSEERYQQAMLRLRNAVRGNGTNAR